MKTKVMTIAELFEESCRLPDSLLESLVKTLWDEVRTRHRRTAKSAALAFEPGELVENRRHSRRLPIAAIGRVVRRAGSKLLVDFGAYGSWNCPGDYLKHAAQGAKVTKKYGSMGEVDPELLAARRGRV